MQNNGSKNLLTVIGLSVLFGLGAGLVGELVARVYLLDNLYSLPMFGDISYSGANTRSNLVIREAKNVIVEQNDKLADVINSSRDSLVGIIRTAATDEGGGPARGYYTERDIAGQGLTLTSDGWIVTNLSDLGDKATDVKDHLIVTAGKKIFPIDKIVKDKYSRFVFIKVAAKDLPVKKFASRESAQNGQLVVTADWRGFGEPNYLVAKKYFDTGPVLQSDLYGDRMILEKAPSKDFAGPAVFNLTGEVVGLTDASGKTEPIYHFAAVIGSLFKAKTISRPALGVNYLDRSELINPAVASDASRQESAVKGALLVKNVKEPAIMKNSAAEKGGLKEGDVILSVNGVSLEPGYNLSDAILSLAYGQEVVFDLLRNGIEKELKIRLGEKK